MTNKETLDTMIASHRDSHKRKSEKIALQKEMEQELWKGEVKSYWCRDLYYDVMRNVWRLYHYLWFVKIKRECDWLSCKHTNPYRVLTPRLLKKQFAEDC